jgi:hypothetical protein
MHLDLNVDLELYSDLTAPSSSTLLSYWYSPQVLILTHHHRSLHRIPVVEAAQIAWP